MIRTAMLLLMSGWLLSVPPASAQDVGPDLDQPQPQTIMRIGTVSQCDTLQQMATVINNYGEIPLVKGQGSVFLIQGQALPGNITVWLHPQGESFSVTIDNGQIACMLTSGVKMEPVY